MPTNLARAELRSTKDPNQVVKLDYNPVSVRVEHQSTGISATALRESMEQMMDLGSTRLGISNLTLDGSQSRENVWDVVNLLLRWTKPTEWNNSAPANAKESERRARPRLVFKFGTLQHEVELLNVNADFTRLGRQGKPLRATVSLMMHIITPGKSATNPTSGGAGGERDHTVVEGDSLAFLAWSAYGDPGMWRVIADANRIEDPLRLRPGQRLYLPSPDDLRLGATRP